MESKESFNKSRWQFKEDILSSFMSVHRDFFINFSGLMQISVSTYHRISGCVDITLT